MFVCDFCGKETDTVRRIALDRGYDRLSVRHQVKYACEGCSKLKEREVKKISKDSAPAPIDKTL